MNDSNKVKDTIIETSMEVQKYNEKYNNVLYDFLMKASELVELSKDLYQIEETIILNQISLKDYVLNSEICNYLKRNHIENYSIEELKKWMREYKHHNLADLSTYELALSLYEMLEELKTIADSKIEYEVNQLSNWLQGVNGIKNITNDTWRNLYDNLMQQIKEDILNRVLNDKKVGLVVQMLDDIFNYYLYGYPKIPIELVKNN